MFFAIGAYAVAVPLSKRVDGWTAINAGTVKAGNATALMHGLAAFAFPQDEGHAYLFGEFSTNKAIRTALLDRGLSDEQISFKAFWRAGSANADHGEPKKD